MVFRYVSETAIRTVQREIEHVTDEAGAEMKYRVQRTLRTENVPEEIIAKILSEMNHDIYKEINSELNSKFKVERFVMENFKFVIPECIKVDNQNIGYYISIRSTLKNIFSDPTFMCHEEKNLAEGVYQYHRDTLVFQSSVFLQENPNAVSLNLYSDVVSLTNPLGYAKSKHNILHFYFTIADMRSWERSKIANIFNVAFIDYKKGKHHLHIIHAKVYEELRLLEQGVMLNGKLTKFGLLNYLGDNLESNYIAGLQTHFNSGFMCRVCTIQHKQLEDVGKEYPLRTQKDYDTAMRLIEQHEGVHDNRGAIEAVVDVEQLLQQCSDDEEDNDAEESNDAMCTNEADSEDSSDDEQTEGATDTEILKGWKRPCIYNSLKSFSSLHCLPLDALHDVHEGLISYDVPGMLKYFVRQKWFSFEQLNKRMTSFPYSRDVDKPALFLNKTFKRLPGKGMASGLLVQILPFLMLPYLPGDVLNDDIFKMLKIMHRILELTMAESFDSLLIAELEEHVHKYFALRSTNSNEFCSIKPKHHNVLHMADSIAYHGPPTLTWTAR